MRPMQAILVMPLVLLYACSNTSFSGGSGKSAGSKQTARPAGEPDGNDDAESGDAQAAKSDGTCLTGKAAKHSASLLDSSAACAIVANGAQPSGGAYSIVVTSPAPCDFKLPEVTVSGPLFDDPDWDVDNPVSATVPVGSYWNSLATLGSMAEGYTFVAHKFPVGPLPKNAPAVDNGFILVQPDHKSYLLVDAGVALDPATPGYQSAEVTAKQISQTLGFGDTELLQPKPGSAADGYATATVFKAGSVIALYDDTPDMDGEIKVDALLAHVQASGKPPQQPTDGKDEPCE